MISMAPGETRRGSGERADDETPRAPVHDERRADVFTRLQDFHDLSDDWDGYGATPIDGRAISIAEQLITNLAASGLPSPEIFPVPSGGVQLEWTAPGMEFELEVEPTGMTAVFVGDDSTGRRYDGALPGDEALYRQALTNLVARFGGPPAH